MALPFNLKTAEIATEPRKLFLIGAPKVGKSTILSKLKDTLIIDLEEGYRFLTNILSTCVKSHGELKDLAYEAAMFTKKEGRKPYKKVVIDTVDVIDQFALDLGTEQYMRSTQGKTFNKWTKETIKEYGVNAIVGQPIKKNHELYKVVTTLPNGAGYLHHREAFKTIMKWLPFFADTIIFVGHIRDKFQDKDGIEVTVKGSNLTGQLGPILAAQCDACAIVERRGKNTVLNFKVDSMSAGCRIPTLEGKKIVISTKEKDKEVEVDWSDVFPSENV
jgi:hypothetical protein